MKRRIAIFVLAIMVAMSFQSFAFADTTSNNETEQSAITSLSDIPEGQEYASNELLVTFSSSTTNFGIKRAVSSVESTDAEIEEIVKLHGAQKLAVVTVSEEEELESAMNELQSNKKVVAVQPNFAYKVDKVNDPKVGNGYNLAYQLSEVNAEEAWTLLDGKISDKVKVAVIDTGCDVEHEDLQKNIDKTHSKSFLGGKVSALTGDNGWDSSHGTHVIGIIGATANNKLGIAGIASGSSNNLVSIMALGASCDGETLYTYDCIAAISYAIENGARVINMSWISYYQDCLTVDALKTAYYDHDIVLVCSAGNEGSETMSYPNSMSEAISVSATRNYAVGNNQFDHAYSSYGTQVDISAPGTKVYSTWSGDAYASMSGTSMAAPCVSAVAAMVRAANPALTASQVANILYATAKDLGDEGYDKYYGYGFVQADAAVQAALDAKDSIEVTDLELRAGKESCEIFTGTTFDADILVRPATALPEVVWSSDDTTIATVNKIGEITGVSEGQTTIRAMAGDKQVSVAVTVKKAVPIERVEVNIPDYLKINQRNVPFTIDIFPENASDKEFYVETSDPSILVIDREKETEGTVSAYSAGTATVTMRTKDGRMLFKKDIPVYDFELSVTMTKAPTAVEIDQTVQFAAKVAPANACQTITWTSTDESVAVVDKDGTVTGLKGGITYIEATTLGGLRVVQKLEVRKPIYSGSDYGFKVANVYANSLKLQWTSVPKAESYELYKQRANGVFEKIATVKGTTYTVSNLEMGTKYTFMMRALGAKTHDFSSTISGTPNLGKVSIKYLKAVAKTCFKIKWTSLKEADGYLVFVATKKNGKYKQLGKIGKKTTWKSPKVKSKTYFVKVCGYINDDGNIKKGPLCNPVKVVIK